MDKFNEMLILLDEGKFDISQQVSFLILITSNLDINTISETARINKSKNIRPGTPKGVMMSDTIKKLPIGKQTFAITGLKEDSFPFN